MYLKDKMFFSRVNEKKMVFWVIFEKKRDFLRNLKKISFCFVERVIASCVRSLGALVNPLLNNAFRKTRMSAV